MITNGLLALFGSILGNTGYFTESYTRIFASGEYNNEAPQLLNTSDLNNQGVNSMFESGMVNSSILSSTNVFTDVNLYFCENLCSINPDCQGIFNYNLDTPFTRDNYTISQRCNTLNYLGGEMNMPTNFSSESYKKQIKYHADAETSNIEVIILNIYYDDDIIPYNTTIYLDLNNDGILDDGEPNITTYIYDYDILEFTDLEPGVYHIRQIIENGTCAQVYPGLEGNFYFQTNSMQDHFADKVVSWESSIHSHGLKGGIVSEVGVNYSSPSLDYILGNNDSTFLSFCPQETITISFVDDVIHNIEGDDIIINLYNDPNTINSYSTWGDVYISYDNSSWTLVGNVTYDNFKIDLTES